MCSALQHNLHNSTTHVHVRLGLVGLHSAMQDMLIHHSTTTRIVLCISAAVTYSDVQHNATNTTQATTIHMVCNMRLGSALLHITSQPNNHNHDNHACGVVCAMWCVQCAVGLDRSVAQHIHVCVVFICAVVLCFDGCTPYVRLWHVL
jgi:hypothetical protein